MIVNNVPEVVYRLTEMLKQSDYGVVAHLDCASALADAEVRPPALILLGIFMPRIGGSQFYELIKRNPELKDIPVIYISDQDLMTTRVRTFHQGGADYITRPFHLEEVQARVRTHVRLHLFRKRLPDQNPDDLMTNQIAQAN